jgi:ectoine hydroxylase-related dioxygenase (phytanoyl-CoA dioxygenase family)
MPASEHPVVLRPEQADEVSIALSTHGYVVLRAAYAPADVRALNEFCDATQRSQPESWADSDAVQGLSDLTWYNPLCDARALPVLERFVRHERTFPCVQRALGGAARFAEFDFRETLRAGSSSSVAADMPFHHDQGTHGASSAKKVAARVERSKMVISRTRADAGVPHQHEHLCCIVYLTDVGPDEPAFAVVPRSHRIPAFDPPDRGVPPAVREHLGAEYCEVPLLGPAGTAILYDISTYHTRLNGTPGGAGRRTLHTYFNRDGTDCLTDWVLIPERLAKSPDLETKAFYSQWNLPQQLYAASGFDTEKFKRLAGSRATSFPQRLLRGALAKL